MHTIYILIIVLLLAFITYLLFNQKDTIIHSVRDRPVYIRTPVYIEDRYPYIPPWRFGRRRLRYSPSANLPRPPRRERRRS